MYLKTLFLGILMLFTSCFAEPLHTVEASIISTSQEVSMGADVAKKLEKQYGVVDDAYLQARVDRIGQSLVAVCDRKNIKYSFKVLNTKDVNALAVPGGYIYLFKGLVDLMQTDDELAAVLAHEITHVVKRHSVNQIEKQLAMTLIFAVAFGDKAMLLQNLTQQALMSGYSRSDERQADEFGFIYANKAGYNPYGMFVTMGKLNDLAGEAKANYGLFSSHPEPEARVKAIEKYIQKLNVKQSVQTADKKTYSVVDGSWRFNVSKAVGADKAQYRASLLAGALHLVATKDSTIDKNKFIVANYGNYNEIYYDDILLYRVFPEDLDQNFTDIHSLTNAYILMFRDWAEFKNIKI